MLTSRSAGRWLVLTVSVALLLAACGGAGTGNSVRATSDEAAEPAVSEAAVAALRAALSDAPFTRAGFVPPVSVAVLETTSAIRVHAEMTGVRPGPIRIGQTYELACERGEGKPTGEICEVRDDFATVEFTLRVIDAEAITGDVPPEETVRLTISIGGAWPGAREETARAIERIVAATPPNLRVVAYLVPSTRDDTLLLRHSDGWSALLDGRLLSLARHEEERPGIGGVVDPRHLPNWES